VTHHLCAIYIARGVESGLIKIGRTRDVPHRMATLASIHEPMELLATFAGPVRAERDLHIRFSAQLHPSRGGREWFSDDGAIRAYIATLPASQRGARVFRVGAKGCFQPWAESQYRSSTVRALRRRPQSAERDAAINAAIAEGWGLAALENQQRHAARLADPLLYPVDARLAAGAL